MADNDRQGPPDGYGLGVVREALGMGYLSSTSRGAVTFQAVVALGWVDDVEVVVSHKTVRRSCALAWVEDVEIAASSVTSSASPGFVVTLGGPFGPALAPTVAVSYTASPTGQTNAQVAVIVSGTYHDPDGDFPLVDSVGWNSGSPSGWTVTAPWADGGGGSWFSIITQTPIGTGTSIGSFTVTLVSNGFASGYSATVAINPFGSTTTHTDTSTAPFTSLLLPVP